MIILNLFAEKELMRSSSPKVTDRIVSFFSYISAGWVGLIFMILLYFRKKQASRFLRYNVFQSIFISLLYFILCMVLGFVCDLLLHIPYVKYLVSQILLIFNRPVFFDYSILQIFIIGFFVYMAGMSLLGKYPRIYKLSKIIDNAAS